MKQLVTLFLCVIAGTVSLAQNRVKAGDIIRQINDGKEVVYSNVEIEGNLDLTDLKNRTLQRSHISVVDRFNGNPIYESEVEVAVSFTNCTFLGDVIAYYHLDDDDETYIAHFEKDVLFKNCTFRKASEFKYSEFEGAASFAGSTFNATANFKYAEFSGSPSFNDARFTENADFKYTEFSDGPVFTNVIFEEDADFKYASFPRETSFEKATFHGLANFKYSKFRTPLNMDGVSFKGSEDFKYTKVDGRSFTAYLLDR